MPARPVRFALLLGAANVVLFGVFIVLSARNSVPNNTPASEFARDWIAVLVGPVAVLVGATVVHVLTRRGVLRLAIAAIVLVGAMVALTLPFDTGDGVCPHVVTALSGTVRGECFHQTSIVAGTLVALAVAALSFLAAAVVRRDWSVVP
jgi:hypothetical protein